MKPSRLVRVAAGVRPAERLALLTIAAIVLLLFRQPLLGGVLFERDVHLIWHPQVEGFVRAVAGGSLPLWDPSPAFGQPLLGDPGAQVLYPPTWLNLVLRPWTYYTVFAVGHLLFASLAFFALARRWGCSLPAAATGACCWALGGPLVSLVTLWHHFAGACWAPLVFLASERAVVSRRGRDAVLLGAALGLQALAGSADMCALTIAAVLAWTAAVHVQWRRPRTLPRLAATGAAAALVAVLLSAGQWVPSLELLVRSSRRALPDAARTYWSVHPVSMLETLAAEVPSGLPLRPQLRQQLYEGREPFLPSLYLGLPALALAAAGLLGAERRRRLALAGLLLGAVALALGRHAPAFELAGRLLPPLQVLRYPVKAMIVAAFAWSGLVALGVDAWRAGAPRRRWLAAAALPVGAASLVAAAFAVAIVAPARPLLADRFLVSGVPTQPLAGWLVVHATLGGLVAALAWLWRAPRAKRLALAAAAAAVLDLAIAHPVPGESAPPALYRHRPELLRALEPPGGDTDARATLASSVRVYSYDYSDTQRARRWLGTPVAHAVARVPQGWAAGAASALALQMSLAPQTPGRWGLRQGFDVDYRGLQPEPVALLTLLARLVEERPDEILRLLQLASVTHVVAMHPVAGDRLQPLASVEGLFARPVRVFAVPGVLARARVVSGVRVSDGLPSYAALLDPALDPATTVLLPAGREAPPRPGFRGRATIVHERSDAITLHAELSADGYLVLADTYDPGWQVRVDGVPGELLRADAAFRAVRVPAGSHRVEMSYRPPLVLAALWISAAAALALLAYLFRAGRRRLAPGVSSP